MGWGWVATSLKVVLRVTFTALALGENRVGRNGEVFPQQPTPPDPTLPSVVAAIKRLFGVVGC